MPTRQTSTPIRKTVPFDDSAAQWTAWISKYVARTRRRYVDTAPAGTGDIIDRHLVLADKCSARYRGDAITRIRAALDFEITELHSAAYAWRTRAEREYASETDRAIETHTADLLEQAADELVLVRRRLSAAVTRKRRDARRALPSRARGAA